MKFHLLTLAFCLGAVCGQYGGNAPAETEVAANPAAPAEHAAPVAMSTDSEHPKVESAADAPASGCPTVETPPAPLHCTYEPVQNGDCTKPTLKCNCPVNEAFLECATCEPTCDNPTPICTKECKPAQCQCRPEHARQPSGECVPIEKCQEKGTNGAESPAAAGEGAPAPNAGEPATGSCATLKCESDYDCVEHVGGCVKKSTGNCAVSPCAANHKCVENVGCQLEESTTTTHEVPIPLAAANADTMPEAAHSTDFTHEETIPIPKNQAPAHVMCADMKCKPGSVCIEEYGCFTPHDQFVVSKNGGMVESSCEKVFCDQQRSRCVHGTCVPSKMPWKLGHVCSQSPCASSSMICVDDIGCFDAPAVAFAVDRPTRGIVDSRVKRNEHAEKSTLVALAMPSHDGEAFTCSPAQKCEGNAVCIELVGCFKPQDKFIYKDGRIVESSCADVVCNTAESRCVHGNCVPKTAPFRPGFVCTRDAPSVCPTDSLCVDDIGCFAAAPVVAAQQEEGAQTVVKTDSAVSLVAASNSTTTEVKTPETSKSTETSASKETDASPAEHTGTNAEENKSKSKETSEGAETTKTETVPAAQLDTTLPKEASTPAEGNAEESSETKQDANKETTKSKEAAEPKTEEKTPAEPAAPAATAEGAAAPDASAEKVEEPSAPAETTPTDAASAPKSKEEAKETKVETTETKVEVTETKEEAKETKVEPTETEEAKETKEEPAETKEEPAETEEAKETKEEAKESKESKEEATETKEEAKESKEEATETKAAVPASETETAATEGKTEPAAAENAKTETAATNDTKTEGTGAAETKTPVESSAAGEQPETLPSKDDSKTHIESVSSTCMECEEQRKGLNGETMCVRKPNCCPGGAKPIQCFIDPCKGFEQTCTKATMCVAMTCDHCAAMIYDRNMQPVKVGVDSCFMPFSTTNDGDMPKHLPDNLIHS